MDKIGQLGWIEFKFFLFGLLAGIIILAVVIVLSNQGVIPFKIPFICPVGKVA